MAATSRPAPSRLLGPAYGLAQHYLREFHRILAIDFWFNGQVIMLRHPDDPPNELENENEKWRNIGRLPEGS